MILMYHHIADQAGFNTVSAAHFEQQMQWLSQQGYQVTSMDDYAARLGAGDSIANRIALTFDDAYQSFREIALPILRGHRFPVTLYVPTDFVGQSNVWDDGAIPIMDWDALRDISGVQELTIGSHGKTHRHMRSLPTDAIGAEVRESKAILEKELGKPILHFAYPFGQMKDYDGRCKQQLRAAGYASACATIWGRRNSSADLFALHRLEIEPQDDLQRFSAKISRPFHPKYFRQRAKNLLFRLYMRR
ncbi:MAG TPA: polysaccharide deacetylase family protein [Bacteroidia bacterium]|nr:polysaccharide deacetylase family protein [Bacteroidia bacterium]